MNNTNYNENIIPNLRLTKEITTLNNESAYNKAYIGNLALNFNIQEVVKNLVDT